MEAFLRWACRVAPGGDTDGLYAEHFTADDSPLGGEFSLTTPGVNVAGTINTLRAFAVGDGNYLTSWQQYSNPNSPLAPTFFGYYVASATNQAPQIATPISDQSVAANDLFQLNVAGNFTDPDSDPLVYSATSFESDSLPSWLSITGAGLLKGIPPR